MNDRTPEDQRKFIDRVFIIAGIILFAAVIVMSLSMSKTAGSVPRLVSIAGVVLSVITLFMKPKQKRNNSSEEADEEGGVPFKKSFGLIVAYLVALNLIGFIISTILMIFSLAALMGYKKHKVNMICSLVTTAVLYGIFHYVFYVRLPVGILFELFI